MPQEIPDVRATQDTPTLESHIAALAQRYYDGIDGEGNVLTEDRKRVRSALIEGSLHHVCLEEGIKPAELIDGTREAVERALGLLDALKVASSKRHYDSRIEVVHVVSGPGTYFEDRKDQQPPWSNEAFRWRDRDRIKAGIAVVHNVTRARLTEVSPDRPLTNDEQKHAPLLFYNGIPVENSAFQDALFQGLFSVPFKKIVVSDTLRDDGGLNDQVQDLFKQVDTPASPLSGLKHIAIVTNVSAFLRVPFYVQKYMRERLQEGQEALRMWVYAVKDRRGSREPGRKADALGECIAADLTRLPLYRQRGFLPTKPWKFENLQ